MEQIAFETTSKLTDGSGSGSGYGYDDGSGYGYGYGYDYGYGYGYGSGYGSGYGYGDGDGYGYGSGYDYGSGYGSGYGDGYGSGYDYGYGDGYGDGYGYGDGSGYDYGYGDGYDYGYGDGDEASATAYYAALATPEKRDGAVMALWKSCEDGRPANGGSLPPVKVGDIHETTGPLNLCHEGTLHATFRPDKWKGERWWIVALYGEIAVSDDKLGALKREIIAEIV